MNNVRANVIQAIKQAKAALSTAEETTLDIPELNLLVPFSRAQLNEILTDGMATLDGLITDVLAKAGLSNADIDVVIRTGGSSLMVAVKDLLDARFPGKVVAHDPFTSVAGGLAIANYFDYRFGA